MNRTICYLETDASAARIIRPEAAQTTPAADTSWRAEPLPDGDNSALAARGRVEEAAVWAAAQAEPSRRVDLVCLSVEQASCNFIAAPSSDPQVIAAAVRLREQDWGGGAVGVSVQPLVAPSAHKRPSPLERLRRTKKDKAVKKESTRLTVLRVEDGAARLWLDELDQRGVRIGAVTTLWHAICQAWGEGDAGAPLEGEPKSAPSELITCAALFDRRGRITWAWARGRALMTGGCVSIPQPARRDSENPEEAPAPPDWSSECGRLALDWLTWSAQFGARPDRLILVGHAAQSLSAMLERVWPSTPARIVEDADPIAATLARLAVGADAFDSRQDDPRYCLVDLSARPGRVHRRLYTWSAAAIALVAMGIAGLGHQAVNWAGAAEEKAAKVREQSFSDMDEIDPSLKEDPLPRKALEGVLKKVQRDNPAFVDPPPPKPILDELIRLASQLKPPEDSKTTLERFQLNGEQAVANMRAEDFGTCESLRAALAGSPGKIRWTGKIDGQPPSLTLRLSGDWEAR